MIITAQAISLLYQYWLHTELIERMGVFELLMNTPSHHRVHHGRNPQYLDPELRRDIHRLGSALRDIRTRSRAG